MPNSVVVRAASACLLVLLALACGCSQPADPSEYSVVLVTLDTTRADRTGPYGYENVPTPVMDRIADEGVLFEETISQVPITLPSHSSILTGRYPASHGVRHNGLFRLPESELSMAEIFQSAGFKTGAFIGAYVLNAGYGANQGFEVYDDLEKNESGGAGDKAERTADQVNEKVFAWMDGLDPADRMFLWVHYYDPHSPYSPPDKSGRTLSGEGYDREISYTDACLGDLLDRLERDGRLDKTLLVVVGDHGESLGEHREETHGIFLYQGAIRVPFLMRAPGLLPDRRRVKGPVETVDIAPTILEIMALEPAPDIQGDSLVQAIDDGEHKFHYAFAETFMPRLEFGWSELRMVRDSRFKYVEAPRPELYDLRNDPDELENLIDLQPERAAEMAEILSEHDRTTSDPDAAGDAAHVLSPEEEENLRSLGYLGGDFFKTGDGQDGTRPDPKDRIDEGRLVWAARDLLADGKADEAEAILAPLLIENPKNQLARTTRLMVLLRLREFALAEEEALALMALVDEDGGAHAALLNRARHSLAAIYWVRGRKAEALETFRLARENQDPGKDRPTFHSLLLGAAGSRVDAEWIIDEVLSRNPLDGMALSARFELQTASGEEAAALITAEMLARAGEGDGFSVLRAAKLLNKERRFAPAAALFGIVADQTGPNADLLGYLGTSRLQSGDLNGAREAFLGVVELRPDDPRAPFYLGNIALLKGQEKAAREYYDRSLAVNAQFVPPLVNLARYLASKGRTEEAKQTLAEALKRKPGDPGATELLQLIRNEGNS